MCQESRQCQEDCATSLLSQPLHYLTATLQPPHQPPHYIPHSPAAPSPTQLIKPPTTALTASSLRLPQLSNHFKTVRGAVLTTTAQGAPRRQSLTKHLPLRAVGNVQQIGHELPVVCEPDTSLHVGSKSNMVACGLSERSRFVSVWVSCPRLWAALLGITLAPSSLARHPPAPPAPSSCRRTRGRELPGY